MKTMQVCRREFTKRLLQVLGCGMFANFTLENSAYAASPQAQAYRNCPGGLSPTDICNPPGDPDYCPGEMPPADECPSDGNRAEDECMSGLAEADVCDPRVNNRSDQCPSGDNVDDACPPDAYADDKCYSGMPKDDYCPPSGGSDVDDCPGGGSTVDTCEPEGSGVSGGDECGDGSWSWAGNEDDCKTEDPDHCASALHLTDDDTCLTGRNVPWASGANGFDDWCTGDQRGSDNCWSGKDEEDLCIANGTATGNTGAHDDCPGGDKVLDRCGSVGVKGEYSDDYCVTGRVNTDECPDGRPPEDACVGGAPSDDVCYMHAKESDECDRNIAGSDQGGCRTNDDNCFASDKCNTYSGYAQDFVE